MGKYALEASTCMREQHFNAETNTAQAIAGPLRPGPVLRLPPANPGAGHVRRRRLGPPLVRGSTLVDLEGFLSTGAAAGRRWRHEEEAGSTRGRGGSRHVEQR